MSSHHEMNDFLSSYLYCRPDILSFDQRIDSKFWIFQFLEKTETLKFKKKNCMSASEVARRQVGDVNRNQTTVVFPAPQTLAKLIEHHQRNYERDYLHHGVVVHRITRSNLQ